MKAIISIIGFPYFCYKTYKWVRHTETQIGNRFLSLEESLKKEMKIQSIIKTLNSTITLNILNYAEIMKGIHKECICIDGGGNTGEVSAVLLQFGATVHIFEPNLHLINMMRMRFNQYTNNQKCFIHQKAISTKNEIVKFYRNYKEDTMENALFGSSESSSIEVEKLTADIHTVSNEYFSEVQTINFSEFIEQLDCEVYLLKLDIEGSEYDVLIDLIQKNLHLKIKYILVEVHAWNDKKLMPKEKHLKQLIKEKEINNIMLDWG